jgi:hypothetical protein
VTNKFGSNGKNGLTVAALGVLRGCSNVLRARHPTNDELDADVLDLLLRCLDWPQAPHGNACCVARSSAGYKVPGANIGRVGSRESCPGRRMPEQVDHGRAPKGTAPLAIKLLISLRHQKLDPFKLIICVLGSS